MTTARRVGGSRALSCLSVAVLVAATGCGETPGGGLLSPQPRAAAATAGGPAPSLDARESVSVEAKLDPEAGWLWVDRNGQRVARALVYDNGPDAFAGGFARIIDDVPGDGGANETRVGFMSQDGQIAIRPRFGFARPFVEGRAAFCVGCREVKDAGGEHRRVEGGLWGFVEPGGREVIPALYTRAEDFSAGVAMVCTADGGCLRFDRDGKPVAIGS